ncbi:MAG TPA: hypothetical protein VFE62_04695, partial [Gemmataceae bacterium]|nr:hypothetical protein [Gemmataceae bacterium]
MAAKQIKMALGALVIGVIAIAASVTRGQDEQLSPARVREALGEGIKLYKNHDYDTAARAFAIAQAGQQHLTPDQKQDLADFGAQNAAALKGRAEKNTQLQQATLAVTQGRTQEAKQLLSGLSANQYLTPA